jgi:hypothetical protein
MHNLDKQKTAQIRIPLAGIFMRQAFIIFFVLTGLISFAQTCDTIDGQVVNCVDNKGLRQGYWLERKKILQVSGYGCFGIKDDCTYFEKNKFILSSEGLYIDNKKIGLWNYYDNFNNERGDIEKKIIYNNQSTQEINYTYKYFISLSSDTTNGSGRVYLDIDTVKVTCRQKKCIAETSENIRFLQFPINQLEYELCRIGIGVYDREIRIKKTTR